MKSKFQLVLMLLLGLAISKTYATSITFECRDGQPNTALDSITYNYDANTGYFAPDFTLYQVNTDPNSPKEQYYKENKLGWRLSKDQAIHFYAKENAKAITQIDILCFDASYVDTNIKTSVGTIEFVGDRIIRFIIPPGANVTELQIFKDIGSPQLRPVEITINYLVDGETFEAPAPLGTSFEPIAETYYRPWDVVLSTEEPNADIYYTINGSMPTSSSAIYTSPIYIESDTEIKAITLKNGVMSNVESAQYQIRVLPEVLEANTNYLIDFPDLERTAQETPAIAQISMPVNFDPSKEHPIFVWFGGGSGGYTIGTPKSIIENTDFITIGLPYRSWDSPLGGGWQTSWDYHKTMLDSIEILIPNIDPERRIVGGFSSGGAMTAWHINNSNLEFQEYFSAFLPSGATAISSMTDDEYNSINDLPMLITVGENDPRSPFVGIYYEIVAGIEPDRDNKNEKVLFNLLLGVGHALPPQSHPFIREWIYSNIMEGSSLLTSIESIDNAIEVNVTINSKSNTLEITDFEDYKDVTVCISNIQGQILQMEEVKSNNVSIPLNFSIETNAVYVISVIKKNTIIQSKKLMVMTND